MAEYWNITVVPYSEYNKHNVNVWNVTNYSSSDTTPLTEMELDIWIILQISISFSGSLLIVLLLIIMYRLQKLKSGSGLLIAHSLIMDFFFCLIANPLTSIPIYLTQSKISFQYDCVFPGFFLLLTINAANWTAVVLAGNRLTAIASPYCYRHISTKRFTFILLFIIWGIALSCNIPTLGMVPDLSRNMSPTGVCAVINKDSMTFTVIGIIGIYLPIAIMGLIYCALFIVARFGQRRETDGHDKKRHTMTRRLTVAKALFLSYVCYCVCILPPPVLSTFFPSWWRDETRLMLYAKSAQVLGYAASPVFFFLVNADYGNILRKDLRLPCVPINKSRIQKVDIMGSTATAPISPNNIKLNSLGAQSRLL